VPAQLGFRLRAALSGRERWLGLSEQQRTLG
jgi:hypothetical protein